MSVVIATRDRPEMLREAVAAVRAQDYPGPIEVVAVFDQSVRDESLVDDSEHRPVRVIGNRRSPGLAGARNSGIEATAGDIVAFCDDDDLWTPPKLREQVALLTESPDAVLCTSGITVLYDGQEHRRVLDRARVSFADLLEDRHTELHPSTFVFRKQALVEIGMVCEDVPGGFGEDYDLLLRAAQRHAIVNLEQPRVLVRWGAQSYFFQRWQTMSAGLSWMLERYPQFEDSARGSARVHGQIAFAEAAQGNRAKAVSSARAAVRRRWREPRAYLALAVATRVISPALVMRTLHRFGKGI